MDHAECQRLVDIILCEQIFINEKTRDGEFIKLVLDSPTQADKSKAAIIYERAYAEALSSGMSSENELINSYIELGQWDYKNEEKIKGLKKDINTIRKGLLDFLFNVTKLERARQTLRNAENALVALMIERHKLLENSVEYYALLQQQRYLIGKITKKENGDPYWQDEKEFDDERDIELINRLTLKFFQETRIGIKAIREVARVSPWRTLWSSGKDVNNMFGRPVIQLSDSQKDLIYWSHVYDIVYESYERPTSEIVDDDDLLDSWLLRQSDKVDDQAKKNFGVKDTKFNKPGRQEEFIMSDEEGSKRVYDLNDRISRVKIKAKQKFLEKRKKAKETELPESQMEMRQMSVAKTRKSISRR